MTALRGGLRILLAAGALALLSGCVYGVSGGGYYSAPHRHFHEPAPRWRPVVPWHGPSPRFEGRPHGGPWSHHRRHRH